MKRRDFLKTMCAAGVAGTFASLPRYSTAAELHSGKILLTLHAGGGWDHSSFSDPRENPVINHWADTQQAGVAGNLRYAPFAENAEFFNKYYQHMLVVNGIDLQTNGHDAATRHRNTGNLMAGYPSLNELYAAVVAPKVPMPFVREGGFGDTVGIMPFTSLPDETLLRTLANPNFYREGQTHYAESHMSILQRYRTERLEAQLAKSDNLPRWERKLLELKRAREGTGEIGALSSALPDTLDTRDLKGETRGDIRELHLFLVLAAAGLTATATFSTGGWDSHGNHDARHTDTLTHLTRVIDYLWTKAGLMGLDDRLVVHVTSDVGRTPRYNSNNGKDHWSVGSDIVMMKNAPWANRIVGYSGPGHERSRINAKTLEPDANGILLRPKHLHAQLRKVMGIEGDALSQRYNLGAESVPLFDPSVSTGIQV